ncbi:MAG: SUMF1/EgtB/PvdO family nonheme iron enzyme [Muribaculaceae bacterium]|nr:SUMF1/EgtB/PvdO family nonheme iron enzyme [Muribaculaceae bacterium]
MVKVDGGTFTMGATEEQGSDAAYDETPAHKVTLSSFSIGQTEVTQELWKAVMGNNPSEFVGPKHPVENVSWEDCQEFIKKINKLTGKQFRLPSEAEWEYAARGGNLSRGYKYAGSNNINEVAWYTDNEDDETHNVAELRPNELGIYDMSGNVNEWCNDLYEKYNSSSQTNPTGATVGSTRVERGGGFNDTDDDCRVSTRSTDKKTSKGEYLGFRLAL